MILSVIALTGVDEANSLEVTTSFSAAYGGRKREEA